MHISKKKEYDFEEYGSRWQEIAWYGNVEYLKDVKKDLDAIKKLMEIDFRELSDNEFCDLVSNFYSIYITKKDILSILSNIKGVQYNRFERLNSRMTFKDIVSEGHGRDFSWWEETYQIGWLVAASNDLVIDPNYNYSKDEIEEMVRNKKIISLGKFAKAVGFDPKLPYESEKVEEIDIPSINLEFEDDELIDEYHDYFEFDTLKEGESSFSKKVHKSAVSMLRKRLNKKKVLNDCEQIILFLNDNIHTVGDIVRNGYYMDNGQKDEYLGLSEELSDSHKQLSLKYAEKPRKK